MFRIELKVETRLLKIKKKTKSSNQYVALTKGIDMLYLFVFLHSFIKLRKTIISCDMSVCPPSVLLSERDNSVLTDWFFIKFGTWIIF